MIGLVDANNFYVSCERVFQPRLEGRPVGVMSNNDGCVIARSAELKALDIPMGTPAFKLEGLRQRGEIHLLSSNYVLTQNVKMDVNTSIPCSTLAELKNKLKAMYTQETHLRCKQAE